MAWLWGEDLWIQAFNDTEKEDRSKAAGRKTSADIRQRVIEKVVDLYSGLVGDLNIQVQLEKWLEEYMD